VKNEFHFDMAGIGADLAVSELPVNLGLVIGNDTGTTLLSKTKLTAESE
jgi:hypothetical protein